ncbi:MAG: hypothetical protein JWO91_3569 [Acidobacteriaceae bacterium]|jgi:hypothetical protein|nr:hypothetical protein [Acidobacteriaceae bacterium]
MQIIELIVPSRFRAAVPSLLNEDSRPCIDQTNIAEGHTRNTLFWRQPALLQPLSQRLAFQILHQNEVNGILMTNVVDGADIGMIHRGDGARVALEASLQIRVGRKILREDFDCDVAS